MNRCRWCHVEIVDDCKHSGPKKQGFCGSKCRGYHNTLNWLLKKKAEADNAKVPDAA